MINNNSKILMQIRDGLKFIRPTLNTYIDFQYSLGNKSNPSFFTGTKPNDDDVQT